MYHSLGKLASWCWLKTGPPCSKVQIINEQIGRIAQFVNVACVNNFPNSLAGAGAYNPINVWVGGEGGGFKWESLPLVPPGTLLPLCTVCIPARTLMRPVLPLEVLFGSLKNFFPRPPPRLHEEKTEFYPKRGITATPTQLHVYYPPLHLSRGGLVTRWPCHEVALSRCGIFMRRPCH